MRRPIPALLASAAAASLALTVTPGASAGAAAAGPAYRVQTLHFLVHTRANDLGDPATCDVVGDLYTPRAASPTHRVPAVLATNGFGGSKDDQAGFAKRAVERGYAVLSYSGLGFGGSGCKITLDDRDTDGVAARQLVSYLGGRTGIAFLDAQHTRPAPRLRLVRLDRRDHLGRRSSHDPRVGMFGGSYGGEIQFAAAAVDPRIDTLVPMITWNDLSYSLGPNATDQIDPAHHGVSTATPGTTKLLWGLGFSALGVADGVQQAQSDPGRLAPCPNFATFVCPALVTAGSTGYFQPGDIATFRHASVTSYLSRIRIPTLLMQGQRDTLFNLNEATATYTALKRQGTPVKMIWQQWGHSGGPAAGEWDGNDPDPRTQYDAKRLFSWYAHYLKGSTASTGPAFAWFRDWVPYTGIATPAYGRSQSFPVGTEHRFVLSGTALADPSTAVAAGSQQFLTPPAGAPTRVDKADVLSGYAASPLPEDDAPGTSASYTTAGLAAPLDVVGSPRLHLQVDAPAAALSQAAGPAGQLVVFVRLQDVAPDGSASDINALTAPVRVADVTKPFTVTMPGIVHRFAAGHRLRLVIAGGSVNYRGGLTAEPVTITTGSTAQALTVPVTD
ncbi:MAG: CocE/NonD family hydrolase [Marmoricola sp.]